MNEITKDQFPLQDEKLSKKNPLNASKTASFSCCFRYLRDSSNYIISLFDIQRN